MSITMEEQDHIGSRTELKAVVAALISFLVAAATPYALNYYYDAFDGIYVVNLFAMIWVHTSNVLPVILLWPHGLINDPIGCLLRFLFVFEIYRGCRGIVSRRRVLKVGLFVEAWVLIYPFMYNLILAGVIMISLSTVPVPLLLATGLGSLYAVSPPRQSGLWDDGSDAVALGRSTEASRGLKKK
jgi:hypothetical protein